MEKRSESQAGYVIPTINCYPRNKYPDPDFTCRILHHPNQ